MPYSLKTIFKNNTKVAITHFKISVAVKRYRHNYFWNQFFFELFLEFLDPAPCSRVKRCGIVFGTVSFQSQLGSPSSSESSEP